MTYHVVVALPDGRTAYVDHRDPITKHMHRINRKIEANVFRISDPFPGNPDDYAAISTWLDANYELSESCRIGMWPGVTCIHDEDPRDRVVILPYATLPWTERSRGVVKTYSQLQVRNMLVSEYGFTKEQAGFTLKYTADDLRRPSKEWKVPNSNGFITLRYVAGRFSLEDHLEKGVSMPGKPEYTRESKAKTHPRRDSPMPPTARGRRASAAPAAPARRAAPAPAPAPEPEENGQVDFQRYLDKDLSPTMTDYVTWFEDNVTALEDVPIDKLLALGATLYGHFQRSDFNVSQREARRAARAKDTEPEPEPAPAPTRRGRGRPAATSAPAAPEPAPAPARRGRGRPAKAAAEAPY